MRGRSGIIRLVIAAGIILFAVFKYCSSANENEFTGETQYVNLTPDQEIALGLQSTPQMIEEFGGLYPDENLQREVERVGQKLVNNSLASKSPYRFEFHLLADDQTINAFALPGGQIFITYALYSSLKTEDQLAGILGHEIGHVIARHSAARISQHGLTQGVLTGVAVGSGDVSTTQVAAVVAQTINMKYGRDDELQSDDLGVRFMIDAGYEPEEMIEVMQILKSAAGPHRVPEFQSTHPDPDNRMERIRESIKKYRNQQA